MSILSDFEDRVASAVEGLFAGAFRSPVQPAELAKALGKAMDDERMVGVAKVYAPVSYTVALSPRDAENLSGLTPVLAGELATFLTERAREKSYHLASKPTVAFTEHEDLRLGRFRVSAAHAVAEAVEAEPAEAAPAIFDHALEMGGDVERETGLDTLTVTETGHAIVLRGDRTVIGRLRECDICLEDANVSRRHAELTMIDGDWHVSDLDSTNGILVNGRKVEWARLADGDVIEIGLTRLTYHRGGA